MTPAIDLIEIIAARGNTTLNSTVQLTVSLRNDINAFGKRMSEAMSHDGVSPQGSKEATRNIINDMKVLLARIEDAVPLISLALTTSGANLSASLPNTVSPSRLLQASSFLQDADAKFTDLIRRGVKEVQVGPSFSLKLYTIFEGHSRQTQDPNITNITWQETYAKSILEVIRMPMTADVDHDEKEILEHEVKYLYHFRVTENLDDGRYHQELEDKRFRRDHQGFIRGASRDIPVHSIARLFFSASGRLLNIEEARTPVLVLKVNHALRGPSAMLRAIFSEHAETGHDQPIQDQESGEENLTTPTDDLEWLALEMWADDEDDESDLDNFDTASEASSSEDGGVASGAGLSRPSTAERSDVDDLAMQLQVLDMSKNNMNSSPTGKTDDEVATLSLLEYILRLSALQTSEQSSVLAISDERISLFLRDENSQSRSKARQEADAVRRASHERFDTPASSVFYDEFIPGTQVKSRKSRRSRQGTPTSNSSTPITSQHSKDKYLELLDKQETPVSSNLGPSTTGRVDSLKSRRWTHADELSSTRNPELDTSPSNLKQNRVRQGPPINLFQNSNDLQSKTNNGFSSRLRHSVYPDQPGELTRIDDKHSEKDEAKTVSKELSENQIKYMALAIEEARKSIYIPSAFCVGCVIIKHGRVISTGYSRELEGNTHAEQCALDKLQDKEDAEGADIYTTMEPCSERLSGNVPCVQRIIAAKIRRVFQGVEEPADFVTCKGSALLREAGISVLTVPGFEEQAIAIARGEAFP